MSQPPPKAISKSSVNRAAESVLEILDRHDNSTDMPITEAKEFVHAIDLMSKFRAQHSYPMQLSTNGLRQMVQTVTGAQTVAQRLKRMPQIINKLLRYSGMKLARMQDIGGCRAILASDNEIDEVATRIRKSKAWKVKNEYDYRVEPKATGYRALHIVAERTPPDWVAGRLVEVQLRTPGQHAWAETVERAAVKTGYELKDGVGPRELVEYLRIASELFAAIEEGEVDPDLRRRFEDQKKQVSSHISGT